MQLPPIACMACMQTSIFKLLWSAHSADRLAKILQNTSQLLNQTLDLCQWQHARLWTQAASISTWCHPDSDQVANVVQSKIQLWSHMLQTMQACPKVNLQALWLCSSFVKAISYQCQWGTHANLHKYTRGILSKTWQFKFEWNNFWQQIVIKYQMYKSKSNSKPWCCNKNHKEQSQCWLTINWCYVNSRHHQRSLLQCKAQKALCHNTSYLAQWSCPKLLQYWCHWRTIENCLTAISTCHIAQHSCTLLKYTPVMKPVSLLYAVCPEATWGVQTMLSARRSETLKTVGHKGSLPSSAAKKDWYWTKRGSC